MKGLILNDWYLILKKCKYFLACTFIFLLMAFVDNGNQYLMFYIPSFSGLIPMTLLSYNESDKWCTYCTALPVTKAQFVSAKLLMGAVCNLAIILIVAAAEAIYLHATSAFDPVVYLTLVACIAMVGLFLPMLQMPFLFRFGADKGRICYIVAITAFGTISALLPEGALLSFVYRINVPLLLVAAVVLYAALWYLSIWAYKKREV